MYTIDFTKPVHIHFIGIGGISMSGLAEILLKEGFTVSGSDSKESALTDHLTANGAQIFYGQRASNIIDGIMLQDNLVQMYSKTFPCLDGGFAPNEPVDVVIRPEDIDIVPVEQGQLTGTVTSVTFKGMQYDIIVDFKGFKWLIQTTDHSPVGSRIGIKIDPDGIHVMKKSAYSGMFGDYSSFSEEYDELDDASLALDEEESGDEN